MTRSDGKQSGCRPSWWAFERLVMAVCAEHFTPDTLDSGDGCNPNRILCVSHLHPVVPIS